MALLAISIPILPGKSAQFEAFIGELTGRRQDQFDASRNELEVWERTFFQQTPMGDFVIVTLEGDNPEAAFAAFGEKDDEFTRWFMQQVLEIHGLDLTAPPPGPFPKQIAEAGQQDQAYTGKQDQADTSPQDQAYTSQQDQAYTSPQDQADTSQQDQADAGQLDAAYIRQQDQAYTGKQDQADTGKQDQIDLRSPQEAKESADRER